MRLGLSVRFDVQLISDGKSKEKYSEGVQEGNIISLLRFSEMCISRSLEDKMHTRRATPGEDRPLLSWFTNHRRNTNT